MVKPFLEHLVSFSGPTTFRTAHWVWGDVLLFRLTRLQDWYYELVSTLAADKPCILHSRYLLIGVVG